MESAALSSNFFGDIDKETVFNKPDLLYSKPPSMKINSGTVIAYAANVPIFSTGQQSSPFSNYFDFQLQSELKAWESASDADFAAFENNL